MNVAEPVWTTAREHPERLAIRLDDNEWTYAELRDRAAAVASHLISHGVGPGDTVVLVQATQPTYLSSFYGILAAGASVVLANVMATSAELRHLISDSGAKRTLAGEPCSVAASAASAELGVPFDLIEELPTSADVAFEPVARAEDDPAMLLYTSGTTGKPKGCVLGHGSLFAAPDSLGEIVGLTSDDVVVSPLPLFHVYGGTMIAGMTLARGALLSLVQKFDPQKVLDVLARDHATVYAGVPTMHNALINFPSDGGAESFEGLRICISGGASLPIETRQAFLDRFGALLLEGYGMTEMTGAVSFTRPEMDLPAGTVGVPMGGVEVKLVSGTEDVTEPGTVGELYCRGRNLMLGYHNLPEATADAIRDGWYATGDLAEIDEAGVIRIKGRLKELIIRGGYNVYPREVEEVLLEHPDIIDVAVVGVPDDHFGQEVAALIVARNELDPKGLRTWAKDRLSAYKVPRLFAFTPELPKGPTGKIAKKEIGPSWFEIGQGAEN